MAKIEKYQDDVKALKEKEKTLNAIKTKCDNMSEHKDVQPLTQLLSQQLLITIEVLRKQLQLSLQQIPMLKSHLDRIRAEKSPSERTVDSSPMPEHEFIHQHIEVETQTSLADDKKPGVDTSMQTAVEKPTDNILVTQTTSEGHETIKIEYAQNPNVIENIEDVYVDAKYQQPNDPRKTTELMLRNVPQAFETKFVQPDDTTTEVIVDAEGRKQIIVRKVITRTVQQQRIVEQKHQTIVERDVDGERSISHVNVQEHKDKSSSSTVSDASGSKTVTVNQSESSLATGTSPDDLQIVEQIVAKPQITEIQSTSNAPIAIQYKENIEPSNPQHSSIETVVHHVTQQIVRRKKRIIRRVVIIDGKEHVTEEVIEEPDEVQIIESSQPGINVNIVRNIVTQDISNAPIVELPYEDEKEKITKESIEIESIPVQIVTEAVEITKKSDKPKSKEKKGKKERAPKKDKEDDVQVFDLKAAPVDLVIIDAPVELSAELPVASSIADINTCIPAKESEIEISATSQQEVASENIAKQPTQIENIEEIWPENDLTSSTSTVIISEPRETVELIEATITPKDDTVSSEEIWPIDEKTGNELILDKYTTAKETPQSKEFKPEITQEIEVTSKSKSKPESEKTISDEPKQSIKETVEIISKSEVPTSEQIDIPDSENTKIITETITITSVSKENIPSDDSIASEPQSLQKEKIKITTKSEKEATPSKQIPISEPETVTLVSKTIKTITTTEEKIPSDDSAPSESENVDKQKEQDKITSISVASTPSKQTSIPEPKNEKIVTETVAITSVRKEKIPSDESVVSEPENVQKEKIEITTKTEEETTPSKQILIAEPEIVELVSKTIKTIETISEKTIPRKDIAFEPKKEKELVEIASTSESSTPSKQISTPDSENKKIVSETITITSVSKEKIPSDERIVSEGEPENQQKQEEKIISKTSTPITPDESGGEKSKTISIEIVKTEILLPEVEADIVTESIQPIISEIIEIQKDDSEKIGDNVSSPIQEHTISEQSEPEKSSKTFSIHIDEKVEVTPDSEKDSSKKKKKHKKKKSKESSDESKADSKPISKSPQQEKSIEKLEPEIASKEILVETPILDDKKSEQPIVESHDQIDIEGVIASREIPVKPSDPAIVIDSVSSFEEQPPEKAKHEFEKPKSTIDVRTATQLFIENELNVSDATTRTVKVELSPKESPMSPSSVTIKMKMEQNVEQPNLNVNIVEEYVISKPNEEKIDDSNAIDPSVAESIELSIAEDDRTITDKMEMPEIESTPVPFEQDQESSVKIEKQTIISPDESYKTISERKTPVKIVEESVIQSPASDSPEPLATEIIIATEILQEQQIDDAEQQTSPIEDLQSSEQQGKIIEKSIVDSRSIQTSPEVKPLTDEKQTSPIQRNVELIDVQNQTEIPNVNVEIQTSPIPIGDDVQLNVEKITTEVQTEFTPDIKTTEKSMQADVIVVDKGTSPRKVEQEEIVTASDVIPHVTDKVVSDIVQNIPVSIEIKHESTTTDIVRTTENDTQTAAAPEAGSKPKEPYEIHIETSFIVPNEQLSVETQRSGEPVVLEISKTFIVDDKDPTKVTEIKDESTTSKEKPKKSKSKKKKKSKDDVQERIAIPQANIEQNIEAFTPNPTQVTLSIRKTTVIDTFNQRPNEEKEKNSSKLIRSQEPTSSVTIEEVLSSNEDNIDAPVTPGMDSVEEYERSPQAIWTKEILESRELSDVEESLPINLQSQKQWQHANHLIADRIRNTENAQKAHLSNVLHLVSLSDTITPESIKGHQISVQNDLAKLNDATETQTPIVIHRTVIHIIEEISTWLETIEYRVYLNRQNSSDGPSQDKIHELRNLNGELNGIVANVENLSNKVDEITDLIEPEEQEKMVDCLSNLKKQVDAVQNITQQSNDELQNDMKRWTEYITIIETINTTITELQTQIKTIQVKDLPIEDRLQYLDDIEQKNAEQIDEITRNMQLAHTLSRDFPNKPFPVDIHSSYENARNIENSIALERNRLLQLQSLADEYEQTLKQFAQIILLTESLVEQPIAADNLDELHQEMQRHRKFFVNLSHCRTILQSLEENIDTESRKKHHDLHKSLHDKATQILEKASERSQRISLAASKWMALERSLKEENQWLQMAQQRVPDLSEVSSADFERYTTMYKSICLDINQHHAKLIHLTNTAIQLQDLVNAPRLEEESNDCLLALLKLKDELTVYLNRLSMFRDVWITYETLTDRLEQWILQSERELSQINLSNDVSTENTRRFWEIRVHYEVNNNVRNEIANSLEKSLEILPIRDELLQRQFHDQLEERWANISNKIETIQNKIVSGLSYQDLPIDEKLTLLRRELHELEITVSSMKMVIKNEDELNIYIERMQVINNRVNIIFNELGRLSLLPTHDPEQIGELFALSHNISIPVTEQIENALILRESLHAIQKGIKRLRQMQQTNLTVLNVCEESQKLDSNQIEQAIIDCQHLYSELKIQWQEIMRLRQLLHTLPMQLCVPVSPIKLERDLSQLQDEHAEHESRCTQILNSLKNRLALWRRFERQLEIIHQTNNETEFMMDLLKVDGQFDYERLKKTTEHLEVC